MGAPLSGAAFASLAGGAVAALLATSALRSLLSFSCSCRRAIWAWYTARFAASEGMGFLPSDTALINCGSGNSSPLSFVLRRIVRRGASRLSRASFLILSGWSCRSIHLSTPMAITCWTSPGRGPKLRRLSACTARFWSSCPDAELASFFFASNDGTLQAKLTKSRETATWIRPHLMKDPPPLSTRGDEKVAVGIDYLQAGRGKLGFG